ncbi:hypothetical protein CCLMGIMDO_CCLMGIMDO_00244 [Companilactobacillus crustorum]
MKKSLSQSAYGGISGEKYVPYVTDKKIMAAAQLS